MTKRNKNTLLIILFIIIATIYYSSKTKNEKTYSNSTLLYAKTALNIRNNPVIEDNIVRVLNPNEQILTYDSIVNGFILTLNKDNSILGWASRSYLQNNPIKINVNNIDKLIKSNKDDKINYKIIKEEKNKKLQKVNLVIRLEKEINEIQLKNIALELKRKRPNFKNYYIFYLLPQHPFGNEAWALTNFTPELEVKILGAKKESIIKMNNSIVSGEILNIWKSNNAILTSRNFLVKENNKLFIKIIFAKNSYSDQTEITMEVSKTIQNGLTKYTSNNKHGEYYLIEKNGNLALYDEDGKFEEYIKEN